MHEWCWGDWREVAGQMVAALYCRNCGIVRPVVTRVGELTEPIVGRCRARHERPLPAPRPKPGPPRSEWP